MEEKNNRFIYFKKFKIKNKKKIILLLTSIICIIIFLSSFSIGKSLTNIDAEGTLVITPKENMYITDARYI